MEVRTALLLRLELLDWNAVSVGPCVLPDAGDLPGNFHVRLVSLDAEASIRHFSCDNGLRECTDDGELVAEIPVQSLEPVGHGHDGIALRVRSHIAVVDIHHVGGFDEGVIEILLRGIERMVDLESPASLGKVAVNIDVAEEKRGKTTALILGKQGISSCGVIRTHADAASNSRATDDPVSADAINTRPFVVDSRDSGSGRAIGLAVNAIGVCVCAATFTVHSILVP